MNAGAGQAGHLAAPRHTTRADNGYRAAGGEIAPAASDGWPRSG